ncbi:DUF5133 domain-containing protein [Streptomyces candidus]|uniref:DUF5133 domain-containing protein n=1 Tax=Streptomyces candidus TaxID=67283 RepID=A0A7X0LSY3_9ACTN|nr:DUF5133 domain-containing protein [Streptomyces candidus]MBB6438929.1 hypothetical protein [Streptomyces candidus]GHH44289.1 hypothetical protein GCM10018773_31660 [Streptomyces candidus]
MLVPDPKVLRALLTRYAETRFAHAQNPTPETQRALDDVSYTLCVTTSTNRVAAALAAADTLLEQTCCARAANAGVSDASDVVHEQSQADLAA